MVSLTQTENSARRRFSHRARVRAPIDVCWDVFTDHERMGEFTPFSVVGLVEEGKPDRNGLGCVRRLEMLGSSIDELVNYWQPNQLFGYHVITPGVVSHHQGIVRFWELADGGTEWLYDMQLVPDPAVLESTPDLVSYLEGAFRQFFANLECECERRGADYVIPPEPISVHSKGGELA